MFQINYQFVIEAPKQQVWQVINDLSAYPEWNPFVVACQSTLKPGTPIKMHVKLFPGPALPQTETIRNVSEEEYLSYGIELPLGLLRSNREHKLSMNDEGKTLYESRFELAGLLSPLVKKLLERRLTRGFMNMSHGVKLQAEKLHRKSSH